MATTAPRSRKVVKSRSRIETIDAMLEFMRTQGCNAAAIQPDGVYSTEGRKGKEELANKISGGQLNADALSTLGRILKSGKFMAMFATYKPASILEVLNNFDGICFTEPAPAAEQQEQAATVPAVASEGG